TQLRSNPGPFVHYLAGTNSKALWRTQQAGRPSRRQLERIWANRLCLRTRDSRRDRSLSIPMTDKSRAGVTDNNDAADAALARPADALGSVFSRSEHVRCDFIHALQFREH